MADRPETRPSANDMARRNREILAARRAGTPWALIASRFGLSERQARRAYQEALRATDVDAVDAERIVLRLVRSNLAALTAMEARLEAPDNGAAEIGAARTIGSLSSGLFDLLVRAGFSPTSGPGATWYADRTAQALVDGIGRLADRYGIPPGEVEALFREASSDRAVVLDGATA